MTRRSYYESTARQRVEGILDAGSFREWLPPQERTISPHLAVLQQSQAFDDGVVIGRGRITGREVFLAAQEGGFMGGAVGEIHGAKICGVLRRARLERPDGVILLLESGGVRLQEANAGLIGVSEVIRDIVATRAEHIPVIAVIGGPYGCFGGMGIAAGCASHILISEEARLGLSGPEVIETVNGVEEFDSRDRALVWRTVGGKHRYLMGDCDAVAEDSIAAFRAKVAGMLDEPADLDQETLEREHARLSERIERFGSAKDAHEIWRALGWSDPDAVPLMEPAEFVRHARARRVERT
jgi:malonate decarboxylase beta subunit